jgi:hypothetical protein
VGEAQGTSALKSFRLIVFFDFQDNTFVIASKPSSANSIFAFIAA